MQQRQLGPSGLVVGEIGLGCAPMSNAYGPAGDEESVETIRHAVDLGCTMLDTGESYGPPTAPRFHNENLVGQAVHGIRDRVVLATKFGLTLDSEFRIHLDGRPDRVRQSCEGSLERLRTDRIDLYYLHRPDPQVPIEDIVGAMADLVADGKVRYLGLCEVDAETLARAAAVHPITALESEWSMWTRTIDPVLPTARRLGVGIVPYSPLGRGMFTGAIAGADDLSEEDFRRTLPRFQGENLTRNLRVVARLREFAQARGSTVAQLALAWLLAQGPDVVPIPGAEKRSFVDENARAATMIPSLDELEQIDVMLAAEGFAGDRYPDASHSGATTPSQ